MKIEIESRWMATNMITIPDEVEDILEYLRDNSEEVGWELDSGDAELLSWEWTGSLET